MSACRFPRILGRRPRAVGPDDGFTLIEVLVAMAVISTMMLSLTPLFVITMRVNQQQSDRQAAIQAADDAMERARAVQVSALLTNRDQASTIAQAVAAPDEVKVLLTGDKNNTAILSDPTLAAPYLAWDDAPKPAYGPAVLPTTFNPLTLSGVTYRQQWFIGKCGRATPDGDLAPENADRPCQAGISGSTYTPLYRIVVAVGWTDRLCPVGCTYVTTSLISSATEEPVFSIRDSIARVKITSLPGTQTNTVTAALSLPFTADGSNVTWKATGLPTGLAIDPVTGVISGTPSVAGNFTAAQVTATDGNAQEDYTPVFTWVINAAPIVTLQAAGSCAGGVACTPKTFAATKGTAPYTWSWSGAPTAAWPTGTPPGLAMDPTTGTVSGTPTVVGSSTGVTVTVTDKFGVPGPRLFTWTVGPALSVSAVSAVPNTSTTSKVGTLITPVTVTAAGGIPPYVSWSATGLPDGLIMDPGTGTITGKPTLMKNSFSVVITVTDSSANAASRTASRAAFSWRVWP